MDTGRDETNFDHVPTYIKDLGWIMDKVNIEPKWKQMQKMEN